MYAVHIIPKRFELIDTLDFTIFDSYVRYEYDFYFVLLYISTQSEALPVVFSSQSASTVICLLFSVWILVKD